MNRLEDFRLWEYTSLDCFLHQSLPWWSYQQLRRDPLCGLRFMLTKCRFRQSPIPSSQVSIVFFRGRKWQSNASYLRSEYGFICFLSSLVKARFSHFQSVTSSGAFWLCFPLLTLERFPRGRAFALLRYVCF